MVRCSVDHRVGELTEWLDVRLITGLVNWLVG